MFVTAKENICNYFNLTNENTSSTFMQLLVNQWSINGNLNHTCPYKVTLSLE